MKTLSIRDMNGRELYGITFNNLVHLLLGHLKQHLRPGEARMVDVFVDGERVDTITIGKL